MEQNQFRVTVSDEMMAFLDENYTGTRPTKARKAFEDARLFRELVRSGALGTAGSSGED